jgi:dTDP-4-amino-4,6-dideoxy-D-galactose acyltransferase
VSAPPPCRRLDWDSEFFGLRIGRVTTPRLTAAELDRVREWAARHAVDCLFWLGDLGDPESLRTAQAGGFRLTDVRLELSRELDERSAPPGADAADVRPFRADDLPRLREIARTSHTDSRFYQDGRFPRERCDALYERWLEGSCAGGAEVLVAEHEGRPAGYLTCELAGRDAGRIGLVAVAAQARGKGLGRGLVEAGLRRFAAHGCARVAVATQARNASAVRSYERAGFLLRSARPWYHWWSS